MPKGTPLRAAAEAARRSGASFLGTHFTGVKIDKENLMDLLDHRANLDALLMTELKRTERVLLALAVCEIGLDVLGCNNAAEVALFNVTARKRLADAMFLLGRVEVFVWLASQNAGLEDVKAMFEDNANWRRAIRKHAIELTKHRKTEQATIEKPVRSRPLPPPPIVDPVTGKTKRAHRVRKNSKYTKRNPK